jgi:hypothetical protein
VHFYMSDRFWRKVALRVSLCRYGNQRSRSLKGVPTPQNCLLKSMGGVWLQFVGNTVEEPSETPDFQAEYEGSILFTRSDDSSALAAAVS